MRASRPGDVGQVYLTWWDDPLIPGRKWVQIDRADSTTWIQDDLLAELTANAQRALLAGRPVNEPLDPLGRPSHGLAYDPASRNLIIRGRRPDKAEITLVYEVTEEYDTRQNAWIAIQQLTATIPEGTAT